MELLQDERSRLDILQAKALLAENQATIAKLQQEVESLKFVIALSDRTGIPVNAIAVKDGVVIDTRSVEANGLVEPPATESADEPLDVAD